MLDLTPHHLRFDVLIETYWNVNQCIGGRGALIKLVLIETYWNVNMGKHYGYGLSQWVLIETYWNVNCIYTPSHVRAPGINRNILECKG